MHTVGNNPNVFHQAWELDKLIFATCHIDKQKWGKRKFSGMMCLVSCISLGRTQDMQGFGRKMMTSPFPLWVVALLPFPSANDCLYGPDQQHSMQLCACSLLSSLQHIHFRQEWYERQVIMRYAWTFLAYFRKWDWYPLFSCLSHIVMQS